MGLLKALLKFFGGMFANMWKDLSSPFRRGRPSQESLAKYRDGDSYDDGSLRGTIRSSTDWYTETTGRVRARKVYVVKDDGERVFIGDYPV